MSSSGFPPDASGPFHADEQPQTARSQPGSASSGPLMPPDSQPLQQPPDALFTVPTPAPPTPFSGPLPQTSGMPPASLPSGSLPETSGSQPITVPSGSLPETQVAPGTMVGPLAITPEGTAVILPPASAEKPPVKRFARPLPRWALLTGIASSLVTLVVLWLTGSDWADGVKQLSYGAAALALLALLATVARVLGGMTARANPKRRRQMVGSVALIVVLAALFGAGFTPPAPIHRLQAGYLEGRHDWERALAEYQLAGESAPGSHDLARVTTEWGEQLSAAGQYQTAITRFEQVITWYGGAAAEVMRAKSDEIAAYFAWGKQAIDEHNYAAATNHYDALLMLTFCDADCTTKASALDATAYYMLAEAELAAQHYAAAVDTFIVLTTRFASSPEAQKAHADFAKALLGKGKQQLSTSTCAEATKTYENLANNFADTPEGMEAAQDLMSGPQPVKGRFTGGVPPNAVPFVFLIHEENHPGKDQTVQAGRDGSFSFSSVVPGVYDILLGSYNGNSLTISFPTDIPTATIGLCPYDFGDLPDAFPTPGFFPAQVSAASLGLTADSTSLDAPADTFAAAPSSVAVLPGQEFMWRPARRKDIAHSPTSY